VEETEIEIEPVRNQETRRVIWIVVAGGDAYVRSVNSRRGRWYQELIATTVGTIYADGHRIQVRAVSVSDAQTQARVDTAYLRKYVQYLDDVAWLLSSEVRPTTLRLEPVGHEQN
jgi:hypothetical protein